MSMGIKLESDGQRHDDCVDVHKCGASEAGRYVES
jgi:hypothetical protein